MQLTHFAMRWWPHLWLLSWEMLDDVEAAGKVTGEVVLYAFRRQIFSGSELFQLTIERCAASRRRMSA